MAKNNVKFDEFSEPFQQAVTLVNTWPFPDDIEAQLSRLEQRIPAAEAHMFGDLWETYLVQRVD